MLGGAKAELTEVRAQLQRWRETVPERAQRFHRQLDELLAELDGILKRWMPWVGGTDREQLKLRARRLLGIAGGLAELTQAAGELAGHVQHLDRRSGEVEADLAEWLRERCRRWEIELENMGRHTDRYNELVQEKHVLERIRVDLDGYSQALDVLREAATVLRSLRGLEVAPLEARIPELKKSLLANGLTPEMLDEFRAFLKPLREEADLVRQPPPALQSVSNILTELRGWARQLGETQEVAALEEKKGFYAVDWTRRERVELEALEREARDLLETYRERAFELRRKQLQQLEQEMEGFFEVCGHDPELRRRLERLREEHQGVNRPQLQPKWILEHDKERDFFKATAESYLTELGRRLDSFREKLNKGLEALGRKSLSAAVMKKLGELEVESKRLGEMREVEEILGGLRRSRLFEQELEGLGRQAEQESRELEEEKADLTRRHERLRSAARELAVVAEDLSGPIDALGEGSLSLEEARQSAADLADRLTAEEHRFASQCRAFAADYEAAISETREILERAGAKVVLSQELPAMSEADPPDVAAGHLNARIELYDRLEQDVERQVERALELCRSHLEKLEAIPRETLSSGDRDDLDQVAESLRDAAAASPSGARQRLEHLLELIEQCDIVFQQLRQEEIDAEHALEDLKRRWQEFKSAHLRRYLPEIGDRVEALIHGIPENPRSWRDVRHQLVRAEELFEQLDRQARRLAARDLERDLAALRERTKGAPGEETRRATEKLVAEIEKLENRVLPSATLRMKVRSALRTARRRP